MTGLKIHNKTVASRLILGGISAAVFILFLIRSDTAIDYMKKGLKLCSATVIPSLFPFMVISELIVTSGIGNRFGKLISKPIKLLFGVSEGCACAFTLGTVCGFPIGAKSLCSLYDRGEISKNELERAMIFCNNPGSAFVISAAGLSLFGSKQIGIILYISVILSALIVGISARIILGKVEKEEKKPLHEDNSRTEGVYIFTNAVTSSARAMLGVCALVTFFSSLVGCLGSILTDLGLTDSLIAAIFAFFEISSGVGMSAEIGNTSHALLLCAAALGWSGISVHLQISTICMGRGISLKQYFVAKVLQGLICSLLMGAAIRMFSLDIKLSTEAFLQAGNDYTFTNAAFLCVVFFIAAILPVLLKLFSLKRK